MACRWRGTSTFPTPTIVHAIGSTGQECISQYVVTRPRAIFVSIRRSLYSHLPVVFNHSTSHMNRLIKSASTCLVRSSRLSRKIDGSPLPRNMPHGLQLLAHFPPAARLTWQTLLHNIILQHGASRQFLTDRGRQFLSRFINDILISCSTKHKLTTAYHLRTNGLTERMNQTITDMLAMYASAHHQG